MAVRADDQGGPLLAGATCGPVSSADSRDPATVFEEMLALALAYRAGALARPEYGLIYERCVPTFKAPEELVTLVWRCSGRVEDAVSPELAQRGSPIAIPGQVTRQFWATVHGPATLELRGFLGARAAAEGIWRATITRLVAATVPGTPLPEPAGGARAPYPGAIWR
jgi:hypothetical protein